MPASYDFVQLDVFTRTALTGNTLAVFTDARGLTDKEMQALARELGIVALAACFVPARYASRMSPAETLRS
jgi:predicted PhzF superfamily epimerase YddE/YHI9